MSRRVLAAAAIDVVAIIIFVSIGRRSHDEGSSVGGILSVATPFLIGLAAGWVIARAWTRPLHVATGLIIWPATVLVGMLLRHFVFDRGTAVAFVIVATIATGVLLVGWRMVAARTTHSGR